MPRCLSGSQFLRPLSASTACSVRGEDGLGSISGGAPHPTALPSSIPAQCLALRSCCAPRRPLTCPGEDGPASSAGLGDRAWTGERRRPRLVAAVELPGGRLCFPGPGSLPPPPLFQHRGQISLSPRRRSPLPAWSREPRILARPRRRRAALSPARGGTAPTWESSEEGPPSSPPPAAASFSPPCSVLLSTLRNQPTRRSGPSSGVGWAGAGREAGEAQRRRRSEGHEAGTGFSGSWC